ncbi:hypothetical protein [Acetobacterium sp.]|uniref:hypothetical protein n=1 Tax=Acetobacterium sp. TaxID=1872094 RepID=UPI002F40EE8A
MIWTGPELGQFWSDASFASCNPAVNNRDYQDKPVRFLGWDFVYDKDILEFKEALEEEVLDIVRGYPVDKKDQVKLIC